jgi:redox-sensing transcriptional repressor
VGAGNIGRALVSYDRFRREGFQIAAVFDADPSLAGREVGSGLRVRRMSELASVIAEEGINLGIIAVPRETAQQVADALVAAGVQGILNFAPRRIEVREGIAIVSVDFTVSLELLAFQIAFGESGALDPGSDAPDDADSPSDE